MTPRKRFDVIGKPRRRVDGRAKVTGLTRFADDIMLPRMLHCKLLRSPLPHAIIEAIDVSRAQAHPGVHLELTVAAFALLSLASHVTRVRPTAKRLPEAGLHVALTEASPLSVALTR